MTALGFEIVWWDSPVDMMLYVGDLSFSTAEQDLIELFGRFGTVVRAEVVMDRETGHSRGFAFVMMAGGSEEAIQGLHGTEFQGRTLTVKVANGRWWNTQRPPHHAT